MKCIRLEIFVVFIPVFIIRRINDRTDPRQILILVKRSDKRNIIFDHIYAVINSRHIHVLCLKFMRHILKSHNACRTKKECGENG